MKRKIIIIINGKGGSGKDTLVNFVIDELANRTGKSDMVRNISSITPIKDIAAQYGYNDSNKTEKARKFLHDLKAAFVEWNDLPLQYLMLQVYKFMNSDSAVLFVHIREPQEIDKFINAIKETIEDDIMPYIYTLLIKRPETDHKVYGNPSDDELEKYSYNYTYTNNFDIERSKQKFIDFMYNTVLYYFSN